MFLESDSSHRSKEHRCKKKHKVKRPPARAGGLFAFVRASMLRGVARSLVHGPGVNQASTFDPNSRGQPAIQMLPERSSTTPARSRAVRRSQPCSGPIAGAADATIPRKATRAEWKTPTSRSPGTPGHREMASKVDGRGYGGYCDKDESRQESWPENWICTLGRPWEIPRVASNQGSRQIRRSKMQYLRGSYNLNRIAVPFSTGIVQRTDGRPPFPFEILILALTTSKRFS